MHMLEYCIILMLPLSGYSWKKAKEANKDCQRITEVVKEHLAHKRVPGSNKTEIHRVAWTLLSGHRLSQEQKVIKWNEQWAGFKENMFRHKTQNQARNIFDDLLCAKTFHGLKRQPGKFMEKGSTGNNNKVHRPLPWEVPESQVVGNGKVFFKRSWKQHYAAFNPTLFC